MNTLSDSFSRDFHIGAYFLQPNARTEAHIKDMEACGIDLVFGMDCDTATLDLFYKHNIFAVVSDVVPGWFGGDGDNAGTMSQTNKKDRYIQGITAFRDHPAIIGIDMGDEPSSVDFPYYGQMIALMKELLPSKFLYLNIYPSYGMLATNDSVQTEKELGVPSYREYIESYCKNIDLPYLSFDHYAYTSSVDRLLGDLETAASCCKAYDKKLFVVMQVNSREDDVFISEEQLCFQAFSALAFGASAVSWACYSAGWWYNQVLDLDGNKTQQYEKLKKVNHKLRSLAAEYIQYQWTSTESIRCGDVAEFDVFKSITCSQDALLGKFEKGDGEKAIFFSWLDYQNAVGGTLCFALDDGKRAYLCKPDDKKKLVPDTDGFYRVALNGLEAGFITVD